MPADNGLVTGLQVLLASVCFPTISMPVIAHPLMETAFVSIA